MQSARVLVWAEQLARVLAARETMTPGQLAALLGDDTSPPEDVRSAAREHKSLGEIQKLWKQALTRRGMPQKGVMYRWQKTRRTQRSGAGLDIGGGFQLQLDGFTVFAPKPVTRNNCGGVTYGQWKRRWLLDGTPIRSIGAVYIGHYELMQAANPTPVSQPATTPLLQSASNAIPMTTIGGKPLSGGSLKIFNAADLTITKLLERVSGDMEVSNTNATYFKAARLMIGRVLYGETKYVDIDAQGWQEIHDEIMDMNGINNQPLRVETARGYWQSLVWLMDQAVHERSLGSNPTAGVVKKHSRKTAHRARKEKLVLTMSEVRLLERYAMAIDIAADRALHSGLVPLASYAHGLPSTRVQALRVTETVILPRGLPVDVDFYVTNVGGAAFVVPVGGDCRFWSKALLVFILGLTQTMPRTGEMLAWSMDQIDWDQFEILLNRHKVTSVGDSVFGGRHMDVMLSGTKTTTEGRRVGMTQEFATALATWIPIRAELNHNLAWQLDGAEGGGTVVPGLSGKPMDHAFATRLLHNMEAGAGVRLAPPSHFRHSTETTNAELGVLRQATAETEGHSKKVAERSYIGETAARRALVVRVAQEWRSKMDDGWTEIALVEEGYVPDGSGPEDEFRAA
jgi:hypothetical protein